MAKVYVEFLETCATHHGKYPAGTKAYIDEDEFKRLGDSVRRAVPEDVAEETAAEETAAEEVAPQNKAGKPGKKK